MHCGAYTPAGKRLLGEHVPYAIEAWPEGNQRHLSAESGLYGRIITEGLFGIRPTGLRSFTLTPHLPQEWNTMNLRNVCAFGTAFDIEVKRIKQNNIEIKVSGNRKQLYKQTVRNGQAVRIHLPE